MNLAVAALALLANWTLRCWALDATTIDAVARASSNSDELKPIVIPPSGYFEGNDGPWSTFDLRIGSPEQYVRVTVSTATSESLVVQSEYGCSVSVFATVPVNCTNSRGKLFNPDTSTSWNELGLFGLGFEENLGYSQRAQYGLESLGLGLTGPRLENQTVGVIATTQPFYLGVFGLHDQPINFSSLGNSSAPSFLTSLKDHNNIPSLSWSYTAGARYRLKPEYGQLILSGYDTSRFAEENTVTYGMTDDANRQLIVYLQSINYSDGKSGSLGGNLLSTPISISIDSTDPNLWLPNDVCNAFEQAFGLTTDQSTGLYLINDTHHSSLVSQNTTITFALSNVSAGGQDLDITFPYAAFDLIAENPLVNSTSYYFPLKRAKTTTQFTLGRTFLQEAYLSADYERRTFNVSACTWDESAEENIVTILPNDYQNNNGSSGPQGSSQNRGHRLNGGAIAGIIIGAIVVVSILTGLVFCYRPWVNRKKPSTHDNRSSSIIDGRYRKAELSAEGNEIRVMRTYELDSVGKVHELSGESQPGELAGTSVSVELHGN
ncbi:aspartic peptidase domain-containing protein [Xylaria curta]|nr:aspartic peptidase domain-containing protein [Xylaria curta]